jgi:mono/diheme cytochrome c family protein
MAMQRVSRKTSYTNHSIHRRPLRQATITMKLFTLLAALLLLTGCRGMESGSPPIHPNLNMDFQAKFDPQEANPFFADGRAMRRPVAGTVARGMLREDTPFFVGRTEAGVYVQQIPVPVTRELMVRGRERYDIFCTPCHGLVGDGQGLIMTGGFGYTPAPSFHIDRLRDESDGYLYEVIANGVRTMPAYGPQIAVADRWAIVAYMRALQLSQHAPETAVPGDQRLNMP